MSLGELERGVMDVLWDSPDETFTVRDVCEYFPDHAYTTIMTVLSRLSGKGFLSEFKEGRANSFQAAYTREAYITELITEALSTAPDRQAVLAHFAGAINASDRSFLSKLFARKSR
jgi:predicted transcriptional regulator